MARQRRTRREHLEEQPSATISLPPARQSRSCCSCQKGSIGWDIVIIIFVVFTASAYIFLHIYFHHLLEKLPPIQGPEYDPTKWGTYRSHMFFGLRTRSPKSPLFGMMWYEQPEVVVRPNIYHWANQGDVDRYGWYEADGRSFGKQNITTKSGIVQTDWVNDDRGGFTSRIRFNMAKGKRYNVIFYLSSPDGYNKFVMGKKLDDVFRGASELLGTFKVSINMKKNTMYHQTHTTILTDENVPIDKYHDFIVDNLQVVEDRNRRINYLLNQKHNDLEGRFIGVQLNFGNVAEFDVSLKTHEKMFYDYSEFDASLKSRSDKFKSRFDRVFQLNGKNYTSKQLQMAKYSLSNMLGSVGYWYGYNRVITPSDTLQMYGPHSLFSAVPSRPFFPRGFLWDEGFHNMLIRKFDPQLSLEIITSWMNLMEKNGWIPREVILGPEAEARVPAEFIPQRPDVANPPSLFYVVDKLVHDEKVVKKYGRVLSAIYPRLAKWFEWLRATQYGPTAYTFRWRGRNSTIITELNPKTLSSGLDDFPRASHPSDDEYHLDLRCWMALCSKVLERLSLFFGTDDDHRRFIELKRHFNNYEQLLKDHWSERHQGFYDFGKHSEDVALAPVPDSRAPRGFEYQRVTSRAPTKKLVTNVFGYNNLYPLMLKMIPSDSKQLKSILDKIRDERVLWSKFGLRSLSRKSPYYMQRNTEHDPPYWRGYIWINANYMTLSALKFYSDEDGPYRDQAKKIFEELRENLVSNMAKQFEKTGYIWENYDDQTGVGRGTHPFTGWSSLILMIMSDNLET